MKEQDHIEAILNSFDGLKRAESRPFMYTRVRARLNEETNFWTKTSSIIAKPVVAICCLVSVVTVNVYLIIDANSKQKTETVFTAGTESDILQNENFILASNTSYDFNK
ncbi:hypothetical protein [Niabella drilacis]|uniref:Uncharacterized protein n=1 Tax=Niabella drilacis (strain DSM 25811 / CCM 8410 / CCUG 62505 / LMG 26954 / E90) TaxID=1285928 RepID=A0A1G6Q4Y6_NIADE|nr:hypothetical protein [Niabella drilacis]SDC87413.1 hypothetical protein SAMN04487894_104280 [Niabella drilacis]